MDLSAISTSSCHRGMHLDGADIYDATDHCRVCLFDGARRAVYVVQDDPLIEMLRCERCEACSASQMPKKAVLDRFYASYYAGRPRRSATPRPLRFAGRVAAQMGDLAGKSTLRILDFGGGDGSVARAMIDVLRQKSGREIAATIDLVDYEQPGPYATHNIVLRGHPDLQQVDGPYDLIIASASLEHVPEVHDVIKRLMSFAVPGGYFYARTPYVIPIARLVGRIDLTYPAHVHDMGARFWNRFAKSFGLDAETIVSRPSPIETAFSENPIRTMVSALIKLPSHLELALIGRREKPLWNYVGGWEIVLRFNP